MGSPTDRRLRSKLVYFAVLLVLFLASFFGLVWLFIRTVLLCGTATVPRSNTAVPT